MMIRSLPARGVWIEIGCECGQSGLGMERRSPQGECGLKCTFEYGFHVGHHCRSPQGECGLKCV